MLRVYGGADRRPGEPRRSTPQRAHGYCSPVDDATARDRLTMPGAAALALAAALPFIDTVALAATVVILVGAVSLTPFWGTASG